MQRVLRVRLVHPHPVDRFDGADPHEHRALIMHLAVARAMSRAGGVGDDHAAAARSRPRLEVIFNAAMRFHEDQTCAIVLPLVGVRQGARDEEAHDLMLVAKLLVRRTGRAAASVGGGADGLDSDKAAVVAGGRRVAGSPAMVLLNDAENRVNDVQDVVVGEAEDWHLRVDDAPVVVRQRISFRDQSDRALERGAVTVEITDSREHNTDEPRSGAVASAIVEQSPLIDAFQFTHPCASIDWASVSQAPVAQIHREADTRALQQYIPAVAVGDAGDVGGVDAESTAGQRDLFSHEVESNHAMRKAFRVAQLSTQYLLFVRHRLEHEGEKFERAIDHLDQQADKLAHKSKIYRTRIDTLQERVRRQDDQIHQYMSLLRVRNPRLYNELYPEVFPDMDLEEVSLQNDAVDDVRGAVDEYATRPEQQSGRRQQQQQHHPEGEPPQYDDDDDDDDDDVEEHEERTGGNDEDTAVGKTAATACATEDDDETEVAEEVLEEDVIEDNVHSAEDEEADTFVGSGS